MMIFLQNFQSDKLTIKNVNTIVNKWKIIYLYEDNKVKKSIHRTI